MPTFSSSRSNLPEAKVNIPRLITLTKEVPEMPRIDFVLLLRLTVLAGFVSQLDQDRVIREEGTSVKKMPP